MCMRFLLQMDEGKKEKTIAAPVAGKKDRAAGSSGSGGGTAGGKGPKVAKPQAAAANAPPLRSRESYGPGLIDIGANLVDRMYAGEYHGSQYHAPDLHAGCSDKNVVLSIWNACQVS